MFKIFLIYFLFANPSDGTAQTREFCQDIDNVIPEMGSVRNQSAPDRDWFNVWKVRDSGWCFAYTAADLVSHKLKRKVSAAAIAVRYYQERENQGESFMNKPRVGGQVSLAVYASLKNGGFCSEESVKSDTFGIVGKGNNVAEVFYFLENPRNFPKNGCTFESWAANQMFTTINSSEISEIIRQGSGYKSWPELTNKACDKIPHNLFPQDMIAMNLSNDGRDKMISVLHKTLDAGSIVGVGYDAALALIPSIFSKKRESKPKSKIPGHGSSIVGRRWNKLSLKCEFKIRSTYGQVCSMLNVSMSDCKDGYSWIDEVTLRKSITDMTYLK